jgi:hypothetical protein
VIPASDKLFAFETALLGFVPLWNIQRQSAERGKIFGGPARSRSALVCTHLDVQAPVQ